jgi:hypothetical protein
MITALSLPAIAAALRHLRSAVADPGITASHSECGWNGGFPSRQDIVCQRAYTARGLLADRPEDAPDDPSLGVVAHIMADLDENLPLAVQAKLCELWRDLPDIATCHVREERPRLLLYLDEAIRVLAGEANAPPGAPATLVPGGFKYRGLRHDLTGRPLALLRALLESREGAVTAADLRKALDINDEDVNFPEQVIRDTAGRLRKELRRACAAAGQPCPDPLPSTGRGDDLTYRLAMP